MNKLVKALRVAVPAEEGLRHGGKRDIAEFFYGRFRDFCASTPARSSRAISRYIHLDHPLPKALRERIVRWDDRGEGLVRADRFPFYNLAVMELR